MNSREEEIIKEVVNIICQNCKPKRILLFGSRAKNDDSSTSDFDFAIYSKKPNITNGQIEKISGLYKIDSVYLPAIEEDYLKNWKGYL